MKKKLNIEGKNNKKIKNYLNHGASQRKNVFKDMPDVLNSPDVDIGYAKRILMARAREMYKGNSLGLGAIRKIRTNVIGPGLKLKSVIDDEFLGITPEEKEQLEKKIEKIWRLWAESTECDSARFSNFYQIQSLAFITSLIDGECFTLLPYRKRAGELFELKIQLVESERCCNPISSGYDNRIMNGVEVNEKGEVVAYWFVNDYYSVKPIKWQRVEAFGRKTGRKNVLVVMEKERIGQRRGIPLLTPVMEDILQIGRYTKAELMAAVVSAYFSVFIENESEETEGQGFGDEPISEEKRIDNDNKRNFELAPGAILDLAQGQKISIADPKRPNTAFDGFVRTMAMQIGTALELPHDVLLSLFNTSYSASRAALLEAWKMYKTRRQWFVSDFCTPIFEEWMDEAVAKGYIDAPGYFENKLIRRAYLGCEWYGPTQGQLDPLKEVTAAKLKVEEGFSTRTKEAAEMNGTNYMDNIKQRVIEEKQRGEIGGTKVFNAE